MGDFQKEILFFSLNKYIPKPIAYKAVTKESNKNLDDEPWYKKDLNIKSGNMAKNPYIPYSNKVANILFLFSINISILYIKEKLRAKTQRSNSKINIGKQKTTLSGGFLWAYTQV